MPFHVKYAALILQYKVETLEYTVDPRFSDHKFSDNLDLVTLFEGPNLSFST